MHRSQRHLDGRGGTYTSQDKELTNNLAGDCVQVHWHQATALLENRNLTDSHSIYNIVDTEPIITLN